MFDGRRTNVNNEECAGPQSRSRANTKAKIQMNRLLYCRAQIGPHGALLA